jgi:hypothetical protein
MGAARRVGQRLATATHAPNAHRVLQSDGKVSPNFSWLDPERTDKPRDLLTAEGVRFDDYGRADESQHITTDELALRIDADVPGPLPDPDPGQDAELRDRFLEQLAEQQGADVTQAVLTVLNGWTANGGHLIYGLGSDTSCFLMSRSKAHPLGNIWPAAIYPSGKFEIVFQHLRIRPPFDDLARREEFRQRLNKIAGVELPPAKIDLKPSFPLDVLLAPQAQDTLLETLTWFHAEARAT